MLTRLFVVGAAIIMLVLAIVGVSLKRQVPPPVRANSMPGFGPPQSVSTWKVPIAAATPRSVDGAVGSLWTPPLPTVAARTFRRQGFAWILSQFGVSDTVINDLADKDLRQVFDELKQKAAAGDPTAINALGMIGWRCALGRDATVIDEYAASQVLEAQAFPATQKAWFDEAVRSDADFDKRFAAACAEGIDQHQIRDWVADNASRGDGASKWLSRNFTDNLPDIQQRLRDAAATGFPQAQFELAWAIIAGQKGAAGTDADAVNVGDLLRKSAAELATAEGALAECEYRGCTGVEQDVEAAISHAREAAQRGSIDALLDLGPHLAAGQVDPDEMAAWGVVHASLEQQGCDGNGFSADWMAKTTATLNSPTLTPSARTLAEQLWQTYGAQMKASLGC